MQTRSNQFQDLTGKTLSSAVLDAVQDGMTREEAHRLLEVTSELDKVLDRIRHAAHKALSVREIAKMRIDQRRAV